MAPIENRSLPGLTDNPSDPVTRFVTGRMMLKSETIPSVFESGVFRPLRRPKGLVEHHHVTLTVDVGEQMSALSEVAGSLVPEDAQELREIIDREFERVDPREW